MRHFCTYFDSGYLVRALPLYESLVRWSEEPFVLFVLCLDEPCLQTLRRLALPGVVPLSLAELEAADSQLTAVKSTRSRIEYYFTLTSCLTHHLLNRHVEVERLIYMDADLYLFSPIEVLITELGADSVLIIPHRFPDRLRHLDMNGHYNVGLLIFRNDANGRACTAWWRERCIEWCYDRVEEDRFADQKYLDAWPHRFAGVHVCTHDGANVAPWNVERYEIRVRDGRVLVGDTPLLFYHFQGYRRLSRHLIDPGLAVYGRSVSHAAARHVLLPYARAVVSAERLVRTLSGLRGGRAGNSRVGVTSSAGSLAFRLRMVLAGQVMLNVGRRVWYVGDAPWAQRLLSLGVLLRRKPQRPET